MNIKCILPPPVGLVLVLGIACCALAQSSRDLAKNALQEGIVYEKAGELSRAAERFETVWDLDDDDHEFADIRGEAGLHLGMVFVKKEKRAEALAWFDKVAAMKDAPENITSAARKMADKLRNARSSR